MSETYSKPSQTSKMKLLVKVVNASRDAFRIVFTIQNVFRTSRMVLFTKIISGWKLLTFSAKNSILIFCWILKMPLDSVFDYFHQKLHLRSLRGQICLCMYLVPQIWRWIKEISKVCYEETQKNVVSENSCSKNFVNFAFANVLLGNLWNFQNMFHKKHPQMPASAISCRWKMFRPKYIF